MIKYGTNNFFNDKETQDPLIREKLLFKDPTNTILISLFLKMPNDFHQFKFLI